MIDLQFIVTGQPEANVIKDMDKMVSITLPDKGLRLPQNNFMVQLIVLTNILQISKSTAFEVQLLSFHLTIKVEAAVLLVYIISLKPMHSSIKMLLDFKDTEYHHTRCKIYVDNKPINTLR